jgi:PAS domain S-box-containing protein
MIQCSGGEHDQAEAGSRVDPIQALRRAEERYRLAARATNDVVWDYDLQTRCVHWNDALTRRFGHAPAGMATPIEWWEARLHPDDASRVSASIERAIRGSGEYWSEEYRFRCADGHYADVLDRGFVIRDESGRSVRMVGAILDVTDLKATEQRLRRSEERLRLAQETAGLGIFDWDLRDGRTEVSDSYLRIYGFRDLSEVTPERIVEITHPDDRARGLERLHRAPTGESDGRMEFRIYRPSDGELRWLALTAHTLRDETGCPVRRIGVVEDITERKEAEARLRESEENYRFTVELSPQLAWTADGDGSNLEFKRLPGDYADVAGPRGMAWVDEITHPDDLAYRRREWDVSKRSGRPYDVEFRVRNKGGDYRWVRSRGYPRRDENGRIVKWYGIVEDVHAQRAAEQQLQRLQNELSQVARVSAMGTLAGTLAHELNQPLTAVANYMAGSKRLLANHGAKAMPMIAEALDNASRAAVQAGEIVRRLRDLVSRGEVNKQRVELARLVHEACELTFGDQRDRSIELSLEFGPETRTVLADRIQVQQVLVNLLRNAAEAMAESPKRIITLSAMPSGDDQVTVCVEDSGPGVSPEVKRHLFSPFVTTKASGMGVGLSICRSIVEAHGGQLWVEDAPGGGAAFCFTLQRASQEA